MKNKLLAMSIDMVAFALEKGVNTLPTGETPIELLNRISESLRNMEEKTLVVRRGRRRKEPEAEAAG